MKKKHIGNAIKLGVRGFVRICIETCARGCFGVWKYRFRKKGHADKTDAVHLSKMTILNVIYLAE